MTQVTKAALLARVAALEKSLKRETALRKQEAGERKRLEKALADSLEQQTATSEILRVISSSPTDIRPVLDALVKSATRFCGASDAEIYHLDGDHLKAAAHHGPIPAPMGRLIPVVQGTVAGRAVLERRIVHVPDLLAEAKEFPVGSALAREFGYRGGLAVPLLREGTAVGTINLRRTQVDPFTDKQIALLQTFADQAVIAIENVRLFKELEARNRDLTEALEQQTATSEILRIIAQSPTELQPVLDAIAMSALRLCAASDVVIERLEGERFYNAAHAGAQMKGLVGLPLPLTRGFPGGRAILDRKRVIIDDVQLVAESEYPDSLELLKLNIIRSCAEIPLLSEGKPLGSLAVLRAELRPFTDAEVTLLETFADQAVIAIENVRLFTELRETNHALTAAHAHVTEALEQQTATSEILQVISRSPTEVQPVFETIVRNAVRLCGAVHGGVYRFDGQLVHSVAHDGYTPEELESWRKTWPRPATAASIACQAIRTKTLVRIADIETAPELSGLNPEARANLRSRGTRSVMSVPMRRQDDVVGAISLAHPQVDGFSEAHVELLRTFADQAVIAIENVRLFKELQERTGELTRSVEQLTALGEVSRAVSSTLDVETVLATIVSRASQLAGAAGCAIYEYDGTTGQFELRTTHNYDVEYVEALRAVPLRKGEGLMGRAAEIREPIQVPDITQPGAYESSVRATLIRFGYRALLSVPLLREEQIIGSLSLTRKVPGAFSPEVVDVLKTFATQSALAIQNARLFREIADKNRQLEAASRHKSEFLANMSHELRTPLNAVIGFSEVLLQRMFGDLNAKQDEYLKDIYASGQHLLSLINDILDLSKIEAGRMELAPAPFHLPSALENAVTLVRETVSGRS
jgi:GAF domain-containing protein